jgi:GNAT superfamily N-acetyltransferase
MAQSIEHANPSCCELALAGMLARTFEWDLLARYVFPDDAVRGHHLVPVYRLYLRFFAQRGRVPVNVLGVDPTSQRQGLGSELRRAGLRVCDQQHIAAYLETAETRPLRPA